mmetsp:Transcript_21969/g.35332  ORF Transcript_21969/g.35332 Transcript_21969/m.35332 type:complete len:1485 (-) Transcript_21969:798-5252(-)|eukprot:CAMPEP_0203749930 /NCGR_PEP_ID=MMETSP0098-20131031/4286_1 /ASSEMBLY_ACC=CAM_ASM_000208 /TAXON_ID=96639 /ORGANISM=" , Strain NY0313808BC1" /LENGTH=1484 /DNA_ID=CAMNT_0050639051 /DNA_START=427 /DNA_END=4881 /DNA_ORIENTATION=-
MYPGFGVKNPFASEEKSGLDALAESEEKEKKEKEERAKKKAEGTDGEDGEGQGEEDGDEDEVEDPFADIEAMDDFRPEEESYSPEAIQWAQELGDKNLAEYYNHCKGRTLDDVYDLLKKRTWRIRLRGIRYTNHGDLGDFFCSFNFGWDFKLVRKLLRVKASTQRRQRRKRAKNKDNRPVEQARRWKWVKSGTRGLTKYTQVKKDVEKGRPVEFYDSIEFTWHGSYLELYKKVLHVEVWIWHEYMPNEYLAKAEKPLNAIASGEMNMAGPEWEIKTEIRRKGRKEQVVIGSLEFQCVFQEVLKYNIKFQNWIALFTPWYVKREPDGDDEEELLYPYVTFRLHSKVNPFKKVSSKSKRLALRASDHMVKADIGLVPSVSFVGTRIELEEGMLHVDLYDNTIVPFRADLIGKARIPLTSVVENGYLSSKLILVQNTDPMRRCFSCTNSVDEQNEVRNVGQIFGTVDVDAEERFSWVELFESPQNSLFHSHPARLYREFAQVGELHPPELKDFPPHNYSYLAVHIIAARDLIGADSNGLSDPYVTVSWAGQRLKTRTYFETLEPIFDEVLYFQIRSFDPLRISSDELAEYPFVRITLWDADEAGSSDLLGTAKLYLHWITGCSSREAEHPVLQPRHLPVRRRKRGKKKLRDDTILTRVYTDDLKLDGLPSGIDSYVKVAAWFRAPGDGDLKEHDFHKRQANGTDLLLLPNMLHKEKDMLTPCLCYPVDQVMKDVKDLQGAHPRRKLCALAYEGSICETMLRFYNFLERRSPRAFAAVEEIEKVLKLQQLLAPNQYGEKYFLSTYLQPTTPPKSMICPSEVQQMAIRTSNKPNSLFTAATMVRAMEFEDPSDNFFDGAVNINQYTWLDPDFFLSMKKGDIKAHVLLLANLFLGLTADVYVCVGWARHLESEDEIAQRKEKAAMKRAAGADGPRHAKRNKENNANNQNDPVHCGESVDSSEDEKDEYTKLVPHLWLMTRESDCSSCVRNTGKGVKQQNFQPGKDMDSTTAEKPAIPLGMESLGGAVKFWEVTRGAYFPPLPNRWKGQDDEAKLSEVRKGPHKKEDKSRKAKKAVVDAKVEKEVTVIQGPVVTNAVELSEDDMLENDLLQNDHEDLVDQCVDVDEIFALGAGADDGFGQPTHSFRDRNKSNANSEDPHVDMNQGGSLRPLDESEDEESEVSDDGEEGDALNMQRKLDKVNRKKKQAEFKKRTDWVKRHFERMHSSIQLKMPYERLAFVFNHQNLWVNIQHTDDPRAMTYDVEDGPQYGWAPVVRTKPGACMTSISPHYSNRTLGPKLTEEKVSELQHEMTREITSGIYNFRTTHNVETRFAEEETRIPKLIYDVLVAKHELDMTDKISSNGWIPDRNIAAGGRWDPESIGGKNFKTFQGLFRVLHSTCPPGYTGRINFVKVNSSDAKEVRRVVLRRRAVDSLGIKLRHSLHEESHEGREAFAVGVKIIPWPNSVCMAYCAVMVIFPENRTKVSTNVNPFR